MKKKNYHDIVLGENPSQPAPCMTMLYTRSFIFSSQYMHLLLAKKHSHQTMKLKQPKLRDAYEVGEMTCFSRRTQLNLVNKKAWSPLPNCECDNSEELGNLITGKNATQSTPKLLPPRLTCASDELISHLETIRMKSSPTLWSKLCTVPILTIHQALWLRIHQALWPKIVVCRCNTHENRWT